MKKHRNIFLTQIFLFLAAIGLFHGTGHAQPPAPAVPGEGIAPALPACAKDDRPCVLGQIEQTALAIENKSWRDQTLRELAKTWAFEGDTDKAIALVSKIQTPDTQALTIRGIGMTAAEQKFSKEKLDALFIKLRAVSETITHPPSYAIALTYVAMAQAFAGDNEGAWKTASDMKNDALRHKAFAETAEIQAQKGDYKAAMHSIEQIESEAFRNKALNVVSKIFAGNGLYQEALDAVAKITNAYKKSEGLQYVLDSQKPREAKKEIKTEGAAE